MVAKQSGRNRGGGGGGTAAATEVSVEELARVPLQAILLADSFATKFRPITLERPKVIQLSMHLEIQVKIFCSIAAYMLFLI